MKSFGLSPALARSASVFAIATGLVMPSMALAQTASTAPADSTQGTPQANIPPVPAGVPQEQGSTATDAVPASGSTTPSLNSPAAAGDEIVVTGIRASLQRSIDIKRTSSGVVDAISSEDIGKFPDTNLAESLQRITGVSINRTNGEGSQVTVRGFGPGFNLVTLNGRTLASAAVGVVGGDGNSDGAQGNSRSFDFDNLSSEGVRTLEVYKTGRAAIPSGGIGATINVVTRRPLDNKESGLTGSIGAKAVYDTSADDCIKCGSHVTPETSAFASWSNPDQTFGVSVFGSYQLRHFSTTQAGGNDWNIAPYSTFLGYVASGAKITNAPTDPNTLVGFPNDSRVDFSEDRRERINFQGTVQFKPTDRLTLTADGLFAQNRQKEIRSDSSNWFNRPFDEVTFDGNKVISSTTYLHETLSPTKDGPGSENQYRATKDRLQDYGLNGKWELTDNFTISADGHYSKADSLPDNPNGASSTLVAMAGYGITNHSLDYSTGTPVQAFDFNDTAANGSTRQGNRNGVLDVGDIGAQQNRQYTSTQRQRLKEGRIDAGWDLGGGSRFDFGTDYRSSKEHSTQIATRQVLGDWGVSFPGDVEAIAPGQLFEFCLPCKFKNTNLMATGNALKAFRTEDATKLYNSLYNYYYNLPVDPATGTSADGIDHRGDNRSVSDNRVNENIWAAYAQVTWKGQIADHNTSLVAGVRYERTTSKSITLQSIPTALRWDSDNDFTTVYSAEPGEVTGKNNYNNLLPSMDFQIELKQNLIGRFSFSRTLARTDYSNLFAATSGIGANRPTAVGGTATANSGNPELEPLQSDNFDVSVEWYFKPGSYLSAGFFEKRVRNFVGNGVTQQSLFGLTDPTSGAAGTRSGAAKTALTGIGAEVSEVNLFTFTSLIDQTGSVDAATAKFLANTVPGTKTLTQTFVDDQAKLNNVFGNSADPLYNFSVSKPINNNDAKIWGFEIAGTYFLGNTGVGVAAAYTHVRGNIGIDPGAPVSVDQFALLGLSDTANVTLIYDKNGISGRLAYNWRAKYLSNLNVDTFHSPNFTEPFGQLDLNISYDVTPRLAVSLEAINLTEEGVRRYGRTSTELFFAQDLQRRFLLGARYKF